MRGRVTWLPPDAPRAGEMTAAGTDEIADAMHFDRAGAPVTRGANGVYTGVAARTHSPGDPLRYPDRGVEYRDEQGLREIADELTGKPVTLDHPKGLLSKGNRGTVVGKVQRAWIDGERVAVELRIDVRAGVAAIDSGINELSIGYQSYLDAKRYQRNIRVDHLAIVPRARCGPQCHIDAAEANCGCGCGTCKPGATSVQIMSLDELERFAAVLMRRDHYNEHEHEGERDQIMPLAAVAPGIQNRPRLDAETPIHELRSLAVDAITNMMALNQLRVQASHASVRRTIISNRTAFDAAIGETMNDKEQRARNDMIENIAGASTVAGCVRGDLARAFAMLRGMSDDERRQYASDIRELMESLAKADPNAPMPPSILHGGSGR